MREMPQMMVAASSTEPVKPTAMISTRLGISGNARARGAGLVLAARIGRRGAKPSSPEPAGQDLGASLMTAPPDQQSPTQS
jgi:hypothetical protein